MKYQFRPYAKMQPTIVTLTGKVYEKGEHPLYKDFRIIEVVDEEGNIHYAFEDELKSDEVKKQETLKDAAERILHRNEVADGDMILSCTFPNTIKSMVEMAEWQAEKMYSEEDMAESFMACWKANVPEGFECKLSFKEWLEQFKKK